MQIVKIISEHKKIKLNVEGRKKPNTPVKYGNKRVEAIIKDRHGNLMTRHIDVPK